MIDFEAAHKHCGHHREEILASKVCGCFYCLAIYPPAEILEWINEIKDQEVTALCPKCGIDSVIGDKSGYLIDQNFLTAMNKYWFN